MYCQVKVEVYVPPLMSKAEILASSLLIILVSQIVPTRPHKRREVGATTVPTVDLKLRSRECSLLAQSHSHNIT